MSVKMRMPKLTESLSAPLQTDTKPYLIKPVPIGNREKLKLIGGTVAWNQVTNNGNFASTSGWYALGGTISASGNVLTLTLNAVPTSYYSSRVYNISQPFVAGHKYLLSAQARTPKTSFLSIYLNSGTTPNRQTKATANTWTNVVALYSNTSSSSLTFALGDDYSVYGVGDAIEIKNMMAFDLTQMFGSTIADYAYTLEQSTAGSGIAWLKSYGFFAKDYYPYDAGSLLSVKTSGHKMVGRNRLPNNATSLTHNDVTFTVNADGSITANGTATGEAYCNIVVQGTSALAPYLEVGTAYTLSGCPSGGSSTKYRLQVQQNGAYSQDTGSGVNFTYVTGNTERVRIHVANGYTANNLVFYPMVRFSSDTDATYEPYKTTTYPLSDIELRGIPKLVSGAIEYDGDSYEADGTVTRRYGVRAYQAGDENDATVITDKTNTVYPLVTPTTETADAYENPQIVETGGTESFIDGRTVEMPVGNISEYCEAVKSVSIGMRMGKGLSVKMRMGGEL